MLTRSALCKLDFADVRRMEQAMHDSRTKRLPKLGRAAVPWIKRHTARSGCSSPKPRARTSVSLVSQLLSHPIPSISNEGDV